MTTKTKVNINEVLLKPISEVTNDEAVAMATELERLETVVKQLKAKLSDYVAENGAVEVEDGVWDFGTNVRIKHTPKALENLALYIQHIGENPFNFFSLTRTSLNKLDISTNSLAQLGIEFVENQGKTVKKIKKNTK